MSAFRSPAAVRAGGDAGAAPSLLPIATPVHARGAAVVAAEHPHLTV